MSESEVKSSSSEEQIITFKMPNLFRDPGYIVPEFDPVNSKFSIIHWIDKVEEAAIIYDWDDVAIRHFGLSKLTGVAAKWRDSLPRNDERTWQDWVSLLKINFPSTNEYVTNRLEAQNYFRKPNQNILEYFYEKLARCNKAGMATEESIEWILHGLKNNRFRDHLGPLSQYKTPADLLPVLKSASAYIDIRYSTPSFTPKLGTTGSNFQGARPPMKCFKCSQVGHGARECKMGKVITCFKCNRKGHYARDCSVMKSESRSVRNEQQVKTPDSTSRNEHQVRTPDSTSNSVMQIGNSHAKYCKDAILCGKPIKCYVDLGSSCVTIRQDVACELGLTYLEGDFTPLIGYGQGKVSPIGLLTTILSIDGVEAKVKVHVVPNDAQAIPLLVGHPFTEQPHVVIISNKEELKIEQFTTDRDSRKPVKTVLWAKENVIIPNNYLGHVAVNGDFLNQDLCIEGGIRETGELIPRCLIAADSCGTSYIPILNLTGGELEVKTGDIVSRGERVEECCGVSVQREINTVEVEVEEIDTDLESDQIEEVMKVINEYKDLVARNVKQIGCTDKMEARLELEDDKPVVYRPYRLSYKEREQVKDIVEELKQADVVEDSESPFASPILLVKKKTGDVRMVVDYRAINRKTIKQHYPLPLINDQLDRMQGNKYFITLDLFSGYYQVPIKDSKSRSRTAFITPDGHYQFKRLPFGLCNAPSIFQKMINTVLGQLKFDTAMAYLDDIIIPVKCIDEGLIKLRKVFQALREAGLTIRLDKCKFFKRKLEYLGFEISSIGIEPGGRKVKAIKLFPTPKDVRQVRSFVGLASFFRRFVKNFSLIIRPLTDLLCKNAVFKWGDAESQAFDEIKLRLSQKPVLALYSPTAETELWTDASSLGYGAVILQRQQDGKMHPISYFSKKTTKDEAKYHSYELEALAIVNALDRFRTYLLGISFVIKTDCNSLKLLANKRDLSPRVGRWFVKLSEFNYRIEHIKGDSNGAADALSRSSVEEAKELEVDNFKIFGISLDEDWVAASQRADPEICSLSAELESKDSKITKFSIEDGRVYRTTKGRWRLYVPEDLRYDVVSEAHRSLSHLGVEKTLELLKETYYFPKMKEFVSKTISRCINCLYYKVPNSGPTYLHPLEKGSTPFQTVHADHLGPFVVTEHGHKYVLVFVDGYSKYVVLKAVTDVTAEETVLAFRSFISHYGRPGRLITDRGTAFTAAVFEKFCREHGVQHVKVAAGTPRGNGQVERSNRVVKTCLAMLTEKKDNTDWDEKLFDVQWSINNSVHSVTKMKPFDLIFRYEGVGLRDSPLTIEIRRLNQEKGEEIPKKDLVKNRLTRNQKNEEAKIFMKGGKPKKYEIGDLVLVRFEVPATGTSRKLEAKYRGPYEVSKVLRNDRYIVKDIDGEQQSARKYQGVIAHDRLKLVSSKQI